MPQARGSQGVFALFTETTYGTDPGSPAGQKLYLTRFGVQSTQSRIDSNTLTASRERAKPAAGNIGVAGAVACEIGAEWMGTLLKHALGSNATTGAGPYTHTMTLGDLPVGMVLEKDHGSNISGSGRYEKFNGCRVARCGFEFPTEGYCTAGFDVIGAKDTLGASPLDASLDDNGHTPFSAFDATIQEGGGAIAVVTAASIQLDNGLDDSVFTVGGAGVRRALPEGFATVSGQISALFEDATLLNKAIGGTETSLKITLSRGTGAGSAGNESIEFFVQQMLYERATPPVEGPRGLLITLPFKAYKSGSNSALKITLKNAVSAI